MLIIRREQMEIFETTAVSRCEAAVRLFLAETFPAKRRQLLSFELHRHIDGVRKFGLLSECDIAIYITLAFEFFPLPPRGLGKLAFQAHRFRTLLIADRR